MTPAAVVALCCIAIVAVASTVIGSFGVRFARNTSDFLVASRTVGPTANAGAISGEYLSAASFLGVAGLILKDGPDALWYPVGFTAGYETFTFLAGMIILDNYHRWFADSEPVMKALWVWHQVEEIEHGAVAFEVYKRLYGDQEFYRKWMVLLALVHIASETFKAYAHMARIEGWLRNPFRAISSMTFCGSAGWTMRSTIATRIGWPLC